MSIYNHGYKLIYTLKHSFPYKLQNNRQNTIRYKSLCIHFCNQLERLKMKMRFVE